MYCWINPKVLRKRAVRDGTLVMGSCSEAERRVEIQAGRLYGITYPAYLYVIYPLGRGLGKIRLSGAAFCLSLRTYFLSERMADSNIRSVGRSGEVRDEVFEEEASKQQEGSRPEVGPEGSLSEIVEGKDEAPGALPKQEPGIERPESGAVMFRRHGSANLKLTFAPLRGGEGGFTACLVETRPGGVGVYKACPGDDLCEGHRSQAWVDAPIVEQRGCSAFQRGGCFAACGRRMRQQYSKNKEQTEEAVNSENKEKEADNEASLNQVRGDPLLSRTQYLWNLRGIPVGETRIITPDGGDLGELLGQITAGWLGVETK